MVITCVPHRLIPAPPVPSHCLQEGFHVKATHPVLSTWLVLSAKHAEICNALLFPDLWMELEEGENIPPAMLFWELCRSCAGEYKQKLLTGRCWDFLCQVVSFFNCFVAFIFSLVSFFSFDPKAIPGFTCFTWTVQNNWKLWGKKRGIGNYATGFSGGPEQTGSRVQGTGTEGSFEFGLNSGKALLSVSDHPFCMCAWQAGKWLFLREALCFLMDFQQEK